MPGPEVHTEHYRFQGHVSSLQKGYEAQHLLTWIPGSGTLICVTRYATETVSRAVHTEFSMSSGVTKGGAWCMVEHVKYRL